MCAASGPRFAGLVREAPVPEDLRFCEWFFRRGRERARASRRKAARRAVRGGVGIAGLPAVMAALEVCERVLLASKEALVTGGALVMEEAARRGVPILPVDSGRFGDFPVPAGRARNPSGYRSHGLGRRAAHLEPRGRSARHGTGCAQASRLAHGREDHGRLRHDDEQGPGSDRGALPVRHAGSGHFRAGASAKRGAFVGGIRGWQPAGANGRGGYARADFLCAGLSADASNPGAARLDLLSCEPLTFEAPDEARFPCLRLAREALRAGPYAMIALNGANEAAVAAFLENRTPFGAIANIVERILASTLPERIACGRRCVSYG